MNGKIQTVNEVQKQIKTLLSEIKDTEEVTLFQAGGRVLAEDIRAKQSSPPFPKSPYDGYAVRSEDIQRAGRQSPVSLSVVGKIFAGDFPAYEIHAGEAVRIMTGAPIPDGADTVVKQEETDCGDQNVKIYKSQKAYDYYCKAGEDFQTGELLLKKGIRMDAARIGIAAAAGYEKICVRRKVLAAVLTTGNELAKPGEILRSGQIYDSSLYMFSERIRELGGEVIMAVQLPDEEKIICQQVNQAVRTADIIVTTGGVSVGEKDRVKDALKKEGAEFLVERIAVKPGSPTAVSLLDGKLILSLSGNPFAAAVHMELLVRYSLACLLGCEELLPVERKGILKNRFPKMSQSDRYIRGKEEGGRISIQVKKEKSGILSSLNGCNCLIKIEKEREWVAEGEQVWYIRM